jgi:DMSO/TMAO reductase YedYZ molybdopterin-dependent catalytic subunit
MRLSRRDLLALATRSVPLAAAWHVVPGGAVLAQAAQSSIAPGKEKLIIRSVRPPDYETPVALLDTFLTPVDNFYVRCHLPVPGALDAATWTLGIEGDVATPTTLTLDQIKRMPAAAVTMTLECAGNGRAFYDPPVAGIQWTRGAVGTARWTGVPMAELLKRAGVRAGSRFVLMNGADRALGSMQDFVRQLPIDKATHPDTIVAYEMNGQPLPAVHGFPLRAIIPGWEGAYSMKWLTNLRVVDREFDGFWVATAYRYPTKRVAPGAAVDPKDMSPLTGLAVKSLITRPLEGSAIALGRTEVAGFAWAGESEIARVDLSIDQGATWQPARLVGERARFAWRRFEGTFNAMKAESYLILARATDTSGRTQPITPSWNPSGYLWNAPDAVRVEAK